MEPRHVTLRELNGERAEMADLQRVIEAAPRYAQLVTGVPPGQADAQSTYSILPEGKSYDDKFVFGIYLDDRMIGCVDLIRGYPNTSTAYRIGTVQSYPSTFSWPSRSMPKHGASADPRRWRVPGGGR